jgi:hypothetical protein
MQRLTDRVKPMVPMGARERVVRARLNTRLPTASIRALPDFLIIGAMRCGTSSLYKWLGYHPLVAPSLRKEVQYLSIEHGKGERWYRAHFPLRMRTTLTRTLGMGRIQTFEATPDYLFLPQAAARASRLVPEARIIVLLRNPIDRAISHYHHMVRSELEPLGLPEALLAEEERLAGEWARLAEDSDYPCRALRRYSYVARGLYVDQLQNWDRFYPRSRILTVMSDALYRRPAETYAEILRFLDLPPWQPAFRNYSYDRAAPASTSDGSAGVRTWLAERFKGPNARLAAWLGKDPGW